MEKAQASALLAVLIAPALWGLETKMAQGTDCNSSPWWSIGQVCRSLSSEPAQFSVPFPGDSLAWWILLFLVTEFCDVAYSRFYDLLLLSLALFIVNSDLFNVIYKCHTVIKLGQSFCEMVKYL